MDEKKRNYIVRKNQTLNNVLKNSCSVNLIGEVKIESKYERRIKDYIKKLWRSFLEKTVNC